MLTSPPAIARKFITRGTLIAVIVAASLGALAALIYGALAQTALGIGVTSVEVGILGSEELTPNLPLPDNATAQYSTAIIDIPAGDSPAAPLMNLATLLPYVVGGLTCLMIIALAVQLLRRAAFGLASGLAMIALAIVTVGSGFAVPALNAQTELIFVEHLGLPTTGGVAEVWVTPATPLWEFSDWPMILLGLLTALGGWLIVRARQLRLDLEGTI
ncbi:MAG: hypothetical protein ACQEW8_03985 [Actinomycetota bacterium]